MSSEIIFRVEVHRDDSTVPTERCDYQFINSALRHLWKARNVREGYIIALMFNKEGIVMSSDKLFAKVGRRRGLNTMYSIADLATKVKRPNLKIGKNWQRLPNRFNDLK